MKRKLVVCGGLMMALALRAHAEDPPAPAEPREGRGFVIGGGLGPGRINFGGVEGLVLVIGESIGTIELGGGQSLDARADKHPGPIGHLGYDQFRATNLSVQLGVMRRRS